MFRRSVVIVVAGVLMLSVLACSSPVFTNLPIPNIPFLNPAPQEMPTAVSQVLAATVEPKVPSSAMDETGTAASSTPAMAPVSNATSTPVVILQFDTATPQQPPAQIEPTALPLPTVEVQPGVTMPPTIPAPTPIPLPSEPTAPAPDEPGAFGSAPEVVWIDDLRGLRSKVMGWRGGASYPLFRDGDDISRVEEFDISPGGSWLAYTRVGSPDIWQVNTTTGEQRQISPERPWCYRFPAWSPGGERLAFISGADAVPWAYPSRAGIWTSAPDGSDLKEIETETGWFPRKVLLAGWLANGMELIYAVPEFPGPVMSQWQSVSVDTGDSRALSLAGTLYDGAPDSSWLLGDGYTTTWAGGRHSVSFGGLVRVPIDEGAPQVLTPDCRSDIMGQISPDGTRIAFLSMPSFGPTCPPLSGPVTYELWVMNSDGEGRYKIDTEGFIGRSSPQWSADGTRLYYSAWDDEGSSLWRVDASGGAPPEQLADTEGCDRFGVVS